MTARICLVTNTSVAHNPRLLKEADAFHAAGCAVRVVACQLFAEVARHDKELMQRRGWRLEQLSLVREEPAGRRLYRRAWARYQIYRRGLARMGLGGGVAERAHLIAYPELLALACREPADIFIAHSLRPLPIAAHAAAHHGAYLGFDAEDYYPAELPERERGAQVQHLNHYIENKYIRRCNYISAPSAQIADALAERYGVRRPLVVHNVFPWSERERIDGRLHDRCGPALSLYWFSQTIGLERGIQDAIRAAGQLEGPVQIHLRGRISTAVRAELLELARSCGVAERLRFHHLVAPEELVARAAEHDVGLATDIGVAHSLSNALTVTNKYFTYMLAGLALAVSAQPGQSAILAQCPGAGALYPSGDYLALAAILRHWQADPAALRAARAAALEAARVRWNWEHEQQCLLTHVAAVLETPREARCNSWG